VKAGLSDGVSTELLESPFKEGDRIATTTAAQAATGTQKNQATGTFPGATPAAPRRKRF
jgi:hypothetical protein